MKTRIALAALAGLVNLAMSPPVSIPRRTYAGLCDASAAVSLDGRHFVVADDETNVLRIYNNQNLSGEPLGDGFDFNAKLGTAPYGESDIEAAARIGKRIYWIGSHARRKGKGRLCPERHRLFATDIAGLMPNLDLKWVGRYDCLAEDILKAHCWARPDDPNTRLVIELSRRSTRFNIDKVPDLAPDRSGLNIEALAATRGGSALMIGFRNPLADGRAIVVRLSNPDALLTGEDTAARFDGVFFLDLHGLGLRSMEYCERIGALLLVAGPARNEGNFELFRWNGPGDCNAVLLRRLEASSDSCPEALVVYQDTAVIQVLHDEGSKLHGGIRCKDLKARTRRTFTERWYSIR